MSFLFECDYIIQAGEIREPGHKVPAKVDIIIIMSPYLCKKCKSMHVRESYHPIILN